MHWSTSPHRPPHLYFDGAWYFVTATVHPKRNILSSEAHYRIWLTSLLQAVDKFQFQLAAWVALPNHYHVLFMPRAGRDLGQFMQQLNGSTSRRLNLIDNQQGRQVWQSYWDTCLRDERGFWTRFNYIHFNPVKHGCVQEPVDWEFSSYRFHYREGSDSWVTELASKFPVYDLFDDDKP